MDRINQICSGKESIGLFCMVYVLIKLIILPGSFNSVSKVYLCFVLTYCAYHRIIFSSKLLLERRTAAKYIHIYIKLPNISCFFPTDQVNLKKNWIKILDGIQCSSLQILRVLDILPSIQIKRYWNCKTLIRSLRYCLPIPTWQDSPLLEHLLPSCQLPLLLNAHKTVFLLTLLKFTFCSSRIYSLVLFFFLFSFLSPYMWYSLYLPNVTSESYLPPGYNAISITRTRTLDVNSFPLIQ